MLFFFQSILCQLCYIQNIAGLILLCKMFNKVIIFVICVKRTIFSQEKVDHYIFFELDKPNISLTKMKQV